MNPSLIAIIIAQLLSFIGWILLLVSYTKKDINELLFLQIFVAIFELVSYLLLGADAGMLICVVELIKTILYYKTDKEKLVFKICIVCYILISLLTFDHWYACLPVIAMIVDSYGTTKTPKIANISSIISNISWVTYDIIILSYVGALTGVITIICNILVLALGTDRMPKFIKKNTK